MLTTLGPGGRPHVVAVGFTFDAEDGLGRIITGARTQKAANARRGGRAAGGQVDGARRLSLEGRGAGAAEPDRVAAAGAAYGGRGRPARAERTRGAVERTE